MYLPCIVQRFNLWNQPYMQIQCMFVWFEQGSVFFFCLVSVIWLPIKQGMKKMNFKKISICRSSLRTTLTKFQLLHTKFECVYLNIRPYLSLDYLVDSCVFCLGLKFCAHISSLLTIPRYELRYLLWSTEISDRDLRCV